MGLHYISRLRQGLHYKGRLPQGLDFKVMLPHPKQVYHSVDVSAKSAIVLLKSCGNPPDLQVK